MTQNKEPNIEELIVLYHSDLLTTAERHRVDAHFDQHPDAREQAATYQAAVRVMQKGAHQIPKLNRNEWEQMIGGLQNRLETESVLSDAKLQVFTPDPIPFHIRVLRIAAAVLLTCTISFGGYRLLTPLAPPVGPINNADQDLTIKAQKRLQQALPDKSSLQARKSLQRIFQDEFLIRQEKLDFQTQTQTLEIPILAPDTDTGHMRESLIFEARGSAVPVVWILDGAPSQATQPTQETSQPEQNK